ncbi:MAG: hypothetical protein OHK0046_10140 [Anaerolineae bacterium]
MSNTWLMILGMMLVTFGVRYPVLALVGRLTLPEPVIRALRYVPVAVLTAIILPIMVAPENNTLDLSLNNAYLVAGVFAIVIAWWRKNLLLTIVLGMAVFLAWRTLFP